MKLHRFEEIWLVLAVIVIILSMLITGYQTFALDMGPPSHKETLDPQKVDEHELFKDPGVFEVGENEYDVVMKLQAFSFDKGDIEVPVGSTVYFIMTSKVVVHGIQIIDTNVDALFLPDLILQHYQT